MIKIATAATTLAAGLMGGLIAFAPLEITQPSLLADSAISAETGAPEGDAGNGTDPLIPFGTNPQPKVPLGYVNPNHDEGVTTEGQVDTAI